MVFASVEGVGMKGTWGARWQAEERAVARVSDGGSNAGKVMASKAV